MMERTTIIALGLIILLPLAGGVTYLVIQNNSGTNSGVNVNSCGLDTECYEIGTKQFNEQYIFGFMMAYILEDNGYDAQVKQGLAGSVIYDSLQSGDIDTYVEYTGTAYSDILEKPAPDEWNSSYVDAEAKEGLENEGIEVVTSFEFENNYAFAVPESWQESTGVTTLSGLDGEAQNMVLGTDPEFPEREDGLPYIYDIYGWTFDSVQTMSPTTMYTSINNDEVDIITAYTTDARIDRFNLTLLDDDQGALPPYAGMIIANPDTMSESVYEHLEVLQGYFDTETVRDLNFRFDVEQEDAQDIAYDFLVEHDLIDYRR